MKLTDFEFKHILKAHGFTYDTEHDNIYLNDMIVAAVVPLPTDDPESTWFVDYVSVYDRDDASTPALRAVCLLHNIEICLFDDKGRSL